MDSQNYKRIVCGLLAAQLCCAPLTEAAQAVDSQMPEQPHQLAHDDVGKEKLRDTDKEPATSPSDDTITKEKTDQASDDKVTTIPDAVDDKKDSLSQEGPLHEDLVAEKQNHESEAETSVEATVVPPVDDNAAAGQPEETENMDAVLPDDIETPEGSVDASQTLPEENDDVVDSLQKEPSDMETTTPSDDEGDLKNEEDALLPETGETEVVVPPASDDITDTPEIDDREQHPVQAPETPAEEMPQPGEGIGELQPDDIPTVLTEGEPSALAEGEMFLALGWPGYSEPPGGSKENPYYYVEDLLGKHNGLALPGYICDTTDYGYIYMDGYGSERIVAPNIGEIRMPNYQFGGWAVRYVEKSIAAYEMFYSPASYKFPEIAENGQKPFDEELDYKFENQDGQWVLNWADENVQEELKKRAIDANDGYVYYGVVFSALWEKSTNADITAMTVETTGADVTAKTPLLLYGEDICNLSASALQEKDTIEFEKDITSYYARVLSTQTSAHFTLKTYEPGSQITVTGFGESVDGYRCESYNVIEEGVTSEKDAAKNPSALIKDQYGRWSAQNSGLNPAHGVWEIDVPLELADGVDKQYNKIEIQVEAPSGDTKVYTFYIQRLGEPIMTQGYGNTPAGMLWNKETNADIRDEKLEDFAECREWTKDNQPQFTHPSQLYKGKFKAAAWSDGDDLDLDENAIVVYQNSCVTLPKVTVKDSQGNIDMESGNLQRSLTLRVAENGLKTDVVIGETAGTTERIIDGVIDPTQDEILDLRNMNVVPGVYTIEYTYQDDILGKTYSSNPDAFDVVNQDSHPQTFSRKLIVLPIPGDIDMDGFVTVADAVALEKILDQGNVDSLFLYRVCDVNGDGTVDTADVQYLYKGTPLTQANSDYPYYSENTETGKVERKPVTEAETPDPSKAQLTLVYLGKLEADTQPTDSDADAKLTNGDSYWVGLRLDNAANLKTISDNTKAFTGTVTYNPKYLEPYSPAGTTLEDLIQQYCEEYWRAGVKVYVLSDGDSVSSDAKALPNVAGGDESKLSEFRITVVSDEAVELHNGYMMFFPFTMKGYPANRQVMELAMGPRELAIAGETGTAVYSGLDGNVFGGVTQNVAASIEYGGTGKLVLGEDKTPWTQLKPESSKKFCYGGTIDYSQGTPMGTIDADNAKILSDAGLTYDGTSKISGIAQTVGTLDFYISTTRYKLEIEKAPLELQLSPQKRYYGETNDDVNVYTYNTESITNLDLYKENKGIFVTDKPENLTGSMDELKTLLTKLGDKYTGPTFSYRTTEDLAGTLVEASTDANQGDDTYFVYMEGALSNFFEFSYKRMDQESAPDAKGCWSTLTIKKRPILVDEILSSEEDPVYELNTDMTRPDFDTLIKDQMAVYNNEGREFTVLAPGKDNTKIDKEMTLSGDAVYNGDSLSIWYDIQYPTDLGMSPGIFDPELGEFRTVTIQNIRLQDGDADSKNKNYVLVNKEKKLNEHDEASIMYPETETAIGKLSVPNVTEIKLTHIIDENGYPVLNDEKAELVYTHGDPIKIFTGGSDGSDGIWISYYKEGVVDDEGKPKATAVMFSNFDKNGVEVFLAKKEPDKEEPAGAKIPVTKGMYASLSEMDGYYLWVSMEGKDGPLYDRSVNPFAISKKELTLTVASESRFYGESNLEQAVVTYDVDELSPAERKGKTGNLWDDFSADTIKDYTAPTVARLTALNGGAAVTEKTPVGDNYYIKISGASSTNYTFKYAQDGQGADSDYGYANLSVKRRPLIVTKLAPEVPGVYNDDQVYSFSDRPPISLADAEKATVNLPQSGEKYYYQTGEKNEDGLYLTSAGDAVKEGTLSPTLTVLADDDVKVSYRLEYKTDHSTWPYWTLENPTENRDVTISNIELTGKDAGNYILFFSSNFNATYSYPDETSISTTIRPSQTTGIVTQRSVKELKIESTGKLTDYTHGDVLHLDTQSGQAALSAVIVYENETSSDKITYNGTGAGSNFKSNRLHLTWDKPWEVGAEDVAWQPYLIYARDNERTLYVTLEQQGGLPAVSVEVGKLSIKKAELTLGVKDQYRYYGQENDAGVFTLNIDSLKEVDKKLLTTKTGTVSGDDAEETLEAINVAYKDKTPYVAPVVGLTDPAVGKNSPVGTYELALSGGALANYEITQDVTGTLHIVRRPIVVQKITKDPAATLPHGSEATTVQNELTWTEDEANFVLALPGSGGMYPYPAEFGVEGSGRLSGAPKVGEDTIKVSYTATFADQNRRPPIPAGATSVSTGVEISGLKLDAESAKNYYLVYDKPQQTTTANGLLTKRKVATIKLSEQTGAVGITTNYHYGEGLQIPPGSHFEVTYDNDRSNPYATYREIVGEVGEPEIYYWNSSWPIPATQEELANLKVNYADYKASIGERLTKSANDISANGHEGMYLLLVFRESTAEDAKYLAPIRTKNPIHIEPLKLTYDLQVEDKVYDGSRAATGRLNLTNVVEGDEVSVDTGIAFTFVDANVAYETTPADGQYGDLGKVTVEVKNIALTGKDSANYTINSSVLRDWTTGDSEYVSGRPTAAPQATISKKKRVLPELDEVLLTTDIHTNVVSVDPGMELTETDHNEKIHWEYALEYLDESDEAVVTDWQNGRWFGGEQVENGSAQTPDREDKEFGSRPALPRDTWYRAKVRIAESWNYEASEIAVSCEGDLAELIKAAEEALGAEPGTDEGQAETPENRPAATLTKTYQYRLTVKTIPEKDEQGSTEPRLDAVWFTDTGVYEKQTDLDRALDNLENKSGYFDYYWDAGKSAQVKFPLNITEPLSVSIKQEGESGSSVEDTVVNADDNVTVYATAKRSSSGGGGGGMVATDFTVSMDEVKATLGDEPLQIQINGKPSSSARYRWESSNTAVVQVDHEGVLTFVGIGQAVVTVVDTWTNVKKEIRVTVEAPETNVQEQKGYMNVGTLEPFMGLDDDYLFHPEWTITRGEVAILLAKFFCAPADEEPGEPIRFADLRPEAPYAQAVNLLSAHGIITGMTNGNFEGDRPITRSEMVILLARMLRIAPENHGVSTAFNDVMTWETWLEPYLRVMVRVGIVQGVGDNNFAPHRELTRAELASFMSRCMKYRTHQETNMLIPKDVESSYWAYENILRAVNGGQVPLVKEEKQ